MKFCLPITESSIKKVNKVIDAASDFDYLEIWLDYVDNLELEDIEKLSKDLGDKAIFLFRRKNLDPINLRLDSREKAIKVISESESYLDLDYKTQKEELEFIDNENIKLKLILSYHNYEYTPSEEDLDKLSLEMIQRKPEIVKISTLCKSKGDSLRLLNLLNQLKKKFSRVIVSGMGESGLITRIFSGLWGSEMYYCPLKIDKSSAPGQLTLSQVKSILSEIKG